MASGSRPLLSTSLSDAYRFFRQILILANGPFGSGLCENPGAIRLVKKTTYNSRSKVISRLAE